MPTDKINKVIDLIDLVDKYRWITIDVALKLSGWIMHASQLLTPGKSCVKALIKFIYIKSKSLRKKQWIYINDRIMKHLNFWKTFVIHCNGIPINHVFERPSCNVTISTDASGYGIGVYFEGRSIAMDIPLELLPFSIHIKEIYAIWVAIKHFASLITTKKVIILCDNEAVVHALSRKWCMDELLMAFVYEICALSVEYKFYFWMEWISTKDNILADSLSRFDWQRFYKFNHLYSIKLDNPYLTLNLRYF